MALQEYYNTGADDIVYLYETLQEAQSFTPSVSFTIYYIKFLMYRTGSPGTITVELKVTDGDGKPTGSILASGTTNGNTLTTDSGGEWREITFSVPYTLSFGIKYIIIAHARDGVYANRAHILVDASSPTYSGGNRVYFVSGPAWYVDVNKDLMFETYDGFNPPSWNNAGVGIGDNNMVTFKRLVAAANSKIWYEDI